MIRKKTEKTGELRAYAENGVCYPITEWTEFLNVATIKDVGPRWEAALKAYKLRNGDPINLLEDGTFEVVRTGMRLKRRDESDGI